MRLMLSVVSLFVLCACAASSGGRRSAPRPLGPLPAFSDSQWQRIQEVQPAVLATARRHGLAPSLVNGMIWVESRFDKRARGRRGPRGLMQLMPRTGKAMARRLGRRYAPFSADFNIAAGVAYLMMMHERFGSIDLALAAYNGGPGAVIRWRRDGRPPPGPRQRYVSRVRRAAAAFCRRLEPPWRLPSSSPFRCPAPHDRAPAIASAH